MTQWKDDTLKPSKAGTNSKVAFIFTGQGAQWYAMGRELAPFDVFQSSVRISAAYLKASLGCSWDAWDELMASESESKVNRAEFSQPLCLVLQMALVDLLEYWGIKPSSVVGHSSGEIAAAYSAKALTREDCLRIAYYRGLASELAKRRNPHGSMMAVGLSKVEVEPYLFNSVVLACVNSPSSVTIAGEKSDLEQLQISFKDEGIFCRVLQVENAYHSPLMLSVSEEYRNNIRDIAPRDSSVAFHSSVKGSQVPTSQLHADYWVENMCSTVEFVAAMDNMMYSNVERRELKRKAEAPSHLLEVGPHAALKGPIKQFKAARDGLEHLSYESALIRGEAASVTAISAAGSLWTKGVHVDLDKVNGTSSGTPVLTDLPSYPWNHSTSHWHETRQSRNHRFPAFPRHDLIGSRLDSYNPLEPVWKNYLRISELPWLQDHKIHADIVFPAAGMICSVIEAARQFAAADGTEESVSGFELGEVSISQALVIPNNDIGAEVYLHLKPRKLGMGSGPGAWLEFSFCSAQENDVFVEHASGLVQIHRTKKPSEVDGGRELDEEVLGYKERFDAKNQICRKKVTSSSHYDFCESQGLVFGKTFQGLTKVRQHELTVAFETKIPDSRACMPSFCESDYVIHPASLDAVMQAMMIGIPRMDGTQKQVWVPTGVQSIRISRDITKAYAAYLHGICESSRTGAREMTGSFIVGDGKFDSVPGLVMDGFQFKGLGGSQSSTDVQNKALSKLYSSPSWKPDLSLLDASTLRELAGSHCGNQDMVQFCHAATGIVNEMCQTALAMAKLGSTSPPHLHKYVEWMRTRSDLGGPSPPISPDRAEFNIVEERSCGIHGLDDFIEKYPVDGGLLRHTFRSLPAMFAGESVPIATLMADENFSKFYKEAQGLHLNNQITKKWFELKAHKKPDLRIIEIGAGTASTSLPVLQQLSGDGSETPQFSNYTFTDISSGWFENARQVLSDYKSRMDYKVLDISVDPTQQGFEAESYDVVLAINVLHATKDIKETLKNCKRLLKPGGNLVLGEYTNRNDLAHFIFGTLPGWWASEDGRKNGPLLSQSEWNSALKDVGFSGADLSLADNGDNEAHRMSTIVSTKPPENGHILSKRVVIITPDGCNATTQSLASLLAKKMENLGSTAVVSQLSDSSIIAEGKSIVSLLDYEASFLEDLSEIHFEQVKHLLLSSSEILWVTRSDPADGPGHPTKRIISGLLRCLKTEDASRRPHELHFSRDLFSDIEPVSETIHRSMCTILGASLQASQEMETAERDGIFCIPRYMPNTAMNRSLAQTKDVDLAPEVDKLLQPKRPLKMTIGQPGMLDTLHFVDDEDCSNPLPDEAVEIEVQACALNFLDIMIAMGQIQRPDFGHEAAGIVRRIGSRVTRCSPGDRVVYIGQGAMRTIVRAPELAVHRLPNSISIEEGVSIPIAYATAYQSLVNVARVKKGESVLIHAAAGVAKMLEAEIFCTVGTMEKKRAVIALGVNPDNIFSSRDLSFAKGIKRVTKSRGVDVVVNSLAGEALRQTWGCLAPYGRFIEVGKRDIIGNSGLDMRPFVDNTIFAGVNLEHMLVHEPVRCSELVSRVLELFDQGAIGLIRPIVVHDFTKTESAFREMQRGTHIGKLVLRITAESRVPVTPRKTVPLRLDPNATYLLVGGLGGLGRAQALYMAENGARHLAFISRSGSAKQEARDLLVKLEASGVQAKAYAGDVAERTRLRDILFDINDRMPPIKGVIQGAMVLDDSLFHKMSYDQWTVAMRPKMKGSWNLHEMLPESLDFFVVLSSLAGIIGSVSQGNYAAGNTFQDALVHYRHSKGLAAQSLCLGVMSGLGYVEENEHVGARMSMFRLASVDEKQFFHLLRCALAGTHDGESPLHQQLLVGAGSGGILQASQKETPGADFYWLRTLTPFVYLQQLDVGAGDAGETHEEDDGLKLLGQLSQCKSMQEANDISQEILLYKIAKGISIPVEDINTANPVYTYGVDSLVAVELRNWLSMEVKSDLSIFDLTSNAPITEVSKKIAQRSQLVPKAVKLSD